MKHILRKSYSFAVPFLLGVFRVAKTARFTVCFAALCALPAKAQQVPFLSTSATPDGAVKLKWQSAADAIYRVEFATNVVAGATVWKTLIADYPSHGTNTVWTDTGSYATEPVVAHPKTQSRRFYRATKTGTNAALARPTLAVTSPVSNAVISDEVTVSVSIGTSSLPIVETKLFVDGEEIGDRADDGTWTINTTEWPNGLHQVFAAVKVASRLSGPPYSPSSPAPTYAWRVSAYVPVTFNNYVSQIAFSEPFFEPALGQTQRVSAVLGAYSSWTVQVLDQNDTVVRAGTGSGSTLSFLWNGKDGTGSDLPDGVYHYIVSATQTTPPPPGGGGGNGGGSPPSPQSSSLLAFPSQDYVEVLFPPLPPELAEEMGPVSSSWIKRRPVPFRNHPELDAHGRNKLSGYNPSQMAFAPMLSMQSSSAGTSPKVPRRDPTRPVKGTVGTIGVAYFTYPNRTTNQAPLNGIGGRVQIEGINNGSFTFPPLSENAGAARRFVQGMSKAGWKVGFNKADNTLLGAELRRNDYGLNGSNLFNQVNFGLLMGHGTYGTSLDFSQAAGQSFQTYIALGASSDAANPWIRLSDFKFGGGQLRWVGAIVCNLLRDANYQSILNKQRLPLEDDFHLLCGASTVMSVVPEFSDVLTRKLREGSTIADSWFYAGARAHALVTSGITNDVYFRVVGWTSCFSDSLTSYTDPDPTGTDTIDFQEQIVYP